MAQYPNAANHNIPPGPSDPPITPRIIVVHTMAGTMAGSEAHFKDGSGIEAHFGIGMDGRVWQWRDTGIQADAQAAGNAYCISIETEDMGVPEQRWSDPQVHSLIVLMQWLGRVHSIPMRLVNAETERGIGYHRQFADWNPHNHSCPGNVRRQQLVDGVIPALAMITGDIVDDATKIVRMIATGDPDVGADRAVNNLKTIREEVEGIKRTVDTILALLQQRPV